MIRYLAFLAMWLFAMGVYYRAVAPAFETTFTSVNATMTAGGPLSKGLIGTTSDAVLIWIPLISTAGVLLMGYVLSVGMRGTSFRP